MNTKDQAKSGFKTFILTFLVSLLVFGSLYYLVSDSSSAESDIEQETVLGYKKSALAAVDTVASDVVQPTKQNKVSKPVGSPFEELSKQKVDAQPRVVLAGAEESTQSTVPETGTMEVTIGLVGSITLFAIFAYITGFNPKKYAYSKFENNLLED